MYHARDATTRDRSECARRRRLMMMIASLLLLLVALAQQQEVVAADHEHVTPPSHLPAPANLKVEGLDAASAVLSTATPVFSFDHGDTVALQKLLPRGAAQRAYRITVSAIFGRNSSLV